MSTAGLAARLPRSVRALAVLHPFPSLLNAALVAVLVIVAGGSATMAVTLGVAMLGFQISIGSVNDLVDEAVDARAKPHKPIPAGLVTRRTAAAFAIAGGMAGTGLSAVYGPIILALGLGMYGCGLAYDLFLKPTVFAALCWAVAFPLLPLYAWIAATGDFPPHATLLLPVAALAGPTLQLANGIVDLERDQAAGLAGPVVRLGRTRTLALLILLELVIHGFAWATLVAEGGVPGISFVAVGAASACAAFGLWLSAAQQPDLRERGWQAQATAIVLLGAGWLMAA